MHLSLVGCGSGQKNAAILEYWLRANADRNLLERKLVSWVRLSITPLAFSGWQPRTQDWFHPTKLGLTNSQSYDKTCLELVLPIYQYYEVI